jgi:hypothetical protein
VRTRPSGLTTHGRQDVRTRQSGLTTSQKPVILSQEPLRAEECRGLKGLSSHGLLSVRTRPSGLTTPATPTDSRPCAHARRGLKIFKESLRAEECRGPGAYRTQGRSFTPEWPEDL